MIRVMHERVRRDVLVWAAVWAKVLSEK